MILNPVAIPTDAIAVTQGADWAFHAVLLDADGNPWDWTGWTGRFQAYTTPRAADPLVALSTDVDGGMLLGTDGSLDLALAKADTALLTPGYYSYGLELTDADGLTSLIAVGPFPVAPKELSL